MADFVKKEVRRRIMASVRQRNTKPELVVRSLLHSMGYRFRLHGRDLPVPQISSSCLNTMRSYSLTVAFGINIQVVR